MTELLTLRVNGAQHEVAAGTDESLLQVLRYRLGLLGTKENCLKGECGVCTVLLDGKAVYSCLVLAFMARGHEVTTVEGLARAGEASDLQAAFLRRGALQCGYCTPGMLISAHALLDASPRVDEQAVRDALAGNLCRCTGYGPIVDAVLDVAAARRASASANLAGTEA